MPNSGHLAAISVTESSPSLSSFFLDIAKMFHNIRLSPSLASLFPLTSIDFGDHPGCFQRTLQERLGYRPQQSHKMRPCQRTLPMGFKWSVFIGHTFVESWYSEAFQIFLHNSRIFKTSHTFPIPVLLHKHKGIVELTKKTVLVLHIIDDLNLVLVGWPNEETARLQHTIESVLSQNQLPVKRSKSFPLG